MHNGFPIPRLLLLWAALVLAPTAPARSAPPQLPAVIGDGMVLQRETRVPIWGRAAPGEPITVRFAGQEKRAMADADGKWRLDLDPLPASAKPATLTIAGAETIEVKDVLVGDVWLCSGQSNMQMGLAKSADGEAAVAAADHPSIRLFNVANHIRPPDEDVTGKWAACAPATAARFSAVGYYFGREIHRDVGVPVGLINSSWGATRGEAWTPADVLRDTPALRDVLEETPARTAAIAKSKGDYAQKLAAWEGAAAQAKAAGTTVPERPMPPASLRPQNQPGACYESMIRPLIPFAIKGAIWYQGEANLGSPRYREVLPALIGGYRRAWGQGDFPFGIVQLPNNKPPVETPGDSAWAVTRDAQLHASRALPNVGLAVTIDIGDANDGHPKNKKDVGLRLARWALADVYGKAIASSGPTFKSCAIEGVRATLTFEDVGAGVATSDGGTEVREVAIAGKDRQWHWATARIVAKERVEVSSPDVPEPVAVRYAWADNPSRANLTNDSGLPASPFRTDDWR
jgi:sialate O-acetylesterase